MKLAELVSVILSFTRKPNTTLCSEFLIDVSMNLRDFSISEVVPLIMNVEGFHSSPGGKQCLLSCRCRLHSGKGRFTFRWPQLLGSKEHEIKKRQNHKDFKTSRLQKTVVIALL